MATIQTAKELAIEKKESEEGGVAGRAVTGEMREEKEERFSPHSLSTLSSITWASS